jgi:hypothetical protein
LITATGNITAGSFFIGNGSQLTGITAASSYGNANVAAYLPTYTGNLESVTGNIGTANASQPFVIGGNTIASTVTFPGGNIFLGSSSGTTIGIRLNTGVPALTPIQIFSSNTTATGLISFGSNASGINLGSNMTNTGGNINIANTTGGTAGGGANTVFGGNVWILNGSLRTTAATGTLFASAGNVNIGTASATAITLGPSSTGANTTVNGNATVTNTLTFANIARSGGAPTAATDTTIAYKVPIVINGVTYYIALTAAV